MPAVATRRGGMRVAGQLRCVVPAPSPTATVEMADSLLTRREGAIGELTHLLTDAAIAAIERPRLDALLIGAVDTAVDRLNGSLAGSDSWRYRPTPVSGLTDHRSTSST